MAKIFDYPVDSDFILRKKKSIKRKLLEKNNFLEKRIAILGGTTTNEIRDILDIFLLEDGIKVEFYESEYNKYYEDALYGDELEKFNPDIIFIHTSYRNIQNIPNILNSDEINYSLFQNEKNKLHEIWNNLYEKFNCIIIQNNFEYPKHRPHGNLERTLSGGLINFIDKLNIEIANYSKNKNNFFINDINYLSASFGLDKWHDLNVWYGYKYVLSLDAVPVFCKNLSNIIKSIYGKTKKALVLDLDNTLWGGVIGDDGVNNIKIGTETAVGESHTGFQKYIKQLKDRGIILAISSKNEENIAKEGLNLQDMILKEKDFINIKANWEPKYINIETIAKELNIGENSLVFIDDNPVERQSVEENLPDVAVPNIGENIVDYIDFIDKNGYFEITSLSKEDLKRNETYKENIERSQEEKKHGTYKDFLKSLNMVAEISKVEPIYFDRVTQLINKTNQFNLTTKRVTQSEVEKDCYSEDKMLIYGRLKDKFGDNGLISIVGGTIKEKNLHLDLWLMSCRVLKRDMERAMLDYIIDFCKEKKLEKIYGYYYRTEKNNMVANHYKDLGFENIELGENASQWVLNISNIKQKFNDFIKIEKY
ncbi:MAG: HAD-IIIC family phosphatase [Fusobacteriaceae bacterium]